VTQSVLSLVSRFALAGIFLWSGWGKVMAPQQTIDVIAKAGMPLPKVAFGAAVGIEIVCGILLVLGAKTRWASFLLCLFLVLATYYFHLDFSDRMQVGHLLSNLAILGGLLHVAAYGPGRISLDRS
jgi:putative oxidoreductase